MIYMLDTNILIYLIKNKPKSVSEKINALDTNVQLCMSFFTYAELLKGAERSTKKQQVLRNLKHLTQEIPVQYSVNPSLCVYYATHFTYLKNNGITIGANDLWIASHALSEDATLVTHNTKEFSRVENLRLEDWAVEH